MGEGRVLRLLFCLDFCPIVESRKSIFLSTAFKAPPSCSDSKAPGLNPASPLGRKVRGVGEYTDSGAGEVFTYPLTIENQIWIVEGCLQCSGTCETSWLVLGAHEGGPQWLWNHPGVIKKPSSLGRKLRDQPSLEVSLAVNQNKILCRGMLRAPGSCLKAPWAFPVDSSQDA